MPVAFRFHLFTVVAIFCMLLIGILVGIALVGDPQLEKQVAHFRDLLDRKQAHVERLTAEHQRDEQFSAALLPILTKGRLSGRSVSVILNHDFGSDEFPDRVVAALKGAGAEVSSVTTILDAFVNLSAQDASSLLRSMSLQVPVEGDLRSVLAAKLALHVALGKPEVPSALRKAGLVRVRGDYARPDNVVVLIGGVKRGEVAVPTDIDLPMIQALQEEGIRCVGCESTSADLSSVRFYLRTKIPTVDNADTAPGQLALVLLLAGQDGNYGEKPGAIQLLPPLDVLATNPSSAHSP